MKPETMSEFARALLYYRDAWGVLRTHPAALLLVVTLFALLQLPAALEIAPTGGLLLAAYRLVVLGPLTFGMSYCFLVAARGRAPQVADLFAGFGPRWLAAVVASSVLPLVLLISMLPAAGALAVASTDPSLTLPFGLIGLPLLFLPLLAMARLSFVPFLLIEGESSGLRVLGESWARTEEVQMRVFLIELLAIILIAVGVMLFLVGSVVAAVLSGIALSIAYDRAPSTATTGDTGENHPDQS
jgi:uncharacterized membrane protein